MSDPQLPGITPPQRKKAGGYRPGAGRPKQEFCKRGHSLTDLANAYITPKGYATCRACASIRRENHRLQSAEDDIF